MTAQGRLTPQCRSPPRNVPDRWQPPWADGRDARGPGPGSLGSSLSPCPVPGLGMGAPLGTSRNRHSARPRAQWFRETGFCWGGCHGTSRNRHSAWTRAQWFREGGPGPGGALRDFAKPSVRAARLSGLRETERSRGAPPGVSRNRLLLGRVPWDYAKPGCCSGRGIMPRGRGTVSMPATGRRRPGPARAGRTGKSSLPGFREVRDAGPGCSGACPQSFLLAGPARGDTGRCTHPDFTERLQLSRMSVAAGFPGRYSTGPSYPARVGSTMGLTGEQDAP